MSAIQKLLDDLKPGLEKLFQWAEKKEAEADYLVEGQRDYHPAVIAKEIGVEPLPTKVWVVTQLYGLISGDHSAPVAVFTSEALAREYMGRQRDNEFFCAYEVTVNVVDDEGYHKEITFFNGQELELN